MPFAELGAGDVTDQPGWEALPDHRAGSYQASTSGGALPRTEQSDWPQKPHLTGKGTKLKTFPSSWRFE